MDEKKRQKKKKKRKGALENRPLVTSIFFVIFFLGLLI